MLSFATLPAVPKAASGIYRILNTVTGKSYVGSAVGLYERFYNHAWHLETGFPSRAEALPRGRSTVRKPSALPFLKSFPIRTNLVDLASCYAFCSILHRFLFTMSDGRQTAMSRTAYDDPTLMPNSYSFCTASGNPPVWGCSLCDWRFTIAQCEPSSVSSLEQARMAHIAHSCPKVKAA